MIDSAVVIEATETPARDEDVEAEVALPRDYDMEVLVEEC